MSRPYDDGELPPIEVLAALEGLRALPPSAQASAAASILARYPDATDAVLAALLEPQSNAAVEPRADTPVATSSGTLRALHTLFTRQQQAATGQQWAHRQVAETPAQYHTEPEEKA